MKFLWALLTYVALGIIIGALIQLAFLGRLEESSNTISSLTRIQEINRSNAKLGISYWDDKEAVTLRLGYVRPKVLSWSPRIILFRNFLSVEECDYLIEIAKPHLRPSGVVDKRTGKGIRHKVRTSFGMSLIAEDRNSHVIQAIEKRISIYSHVPVENGEFVQVMRYEKDQYYKPHYDYFEDPINLMHWGQRIATMLMYLSDDVEGGETYFPEVGSSECSCGGKLVRGLCVRPVKGDALLFWNTGLDGKLDPRTLHGGCDVLAGQKWCATKWMRQNVTRFG